LEMPLLGLVGIDLHLGKSLSLGGGMPTTHSSIHHILSVLCISMFAFFLFLCCSCFISVFQNTKRPKIFLLFLFICFFSFLILICFIF
jgi:hypothetical protein